MILFLQNKELFNSTVICLLEFIPFMNDELVIYFLKIKSYFFTNFKIYLFHFFVQLGHNRITIRYQFLSKYWFDW